MYKTIVVGFDGSESGRAALMESAKRVGKHGGEIILVNAVYFDEEEFGIRPEQLDKRFQAARKACQEAKSMVSSEFGVDMETIVCQGEPHEALIDTARERGADLIALGTHGRKGLGRLIMGSVTASVIAEAPCDVMVANKPCNECTGDYKALLLAFDGSDHSKKALSHAAGLAKQNGADLTALYVIPRYEEMLGFMKTDYIKEILHTEADKILAEARKIVSGNGSLKTVIQEGHAAEKILEIAHMLHSDLIVMGSHGWTGVDRALMGSTTERVISHAGCPVLVVKS